jgi:hypothetical protein
VLARPRADLVTVVDREMAVLGTAFRSIDTPSSPVPIERVTAALNAITSALARLDTPSRCAG